MFEKINLNNTTKIPENNNKSGTAISPVPSNVKIKIPEHNMLGVPDKYWEYRCLENYLLFIVCRFTNKDRKKETRPLTYREFSDNRCGWIYKGLDSQAYHLYRLNHMKNKEYVLICEGEKAADAAANIFPNCDVTTSPFGAGSAHKADWSPLHGKKVIIWPDNDEQGRAYAKSVSDILQYTRAQLVKIVKLDDRFPKKWDLADKLPQGVTNNDLFTLFEQAPFAEHPLNNLSEKVKVNNEIAFQPQTVRGLQELKEKNVGAYEMLRKDLKLSGIRTTELDKQVTVETKKQLDETGDLDQLQLAHATQSQIGKENILTTSTQTWLWNDKGVWATVNDHILKNEAIEVMRQNDVKVSNSKSNSVVELLKTQSYIDQHDWEINKGCINVLNGELYWENEKWVLKNHDKSNFNRTQIPHNYDPTATSPRFDKFLDEIFECDEDKEEKKQTLLEMMGYSLASTSKYEKFIILIGSGANGKSVVLDIVKALVGSPNTAAVQPSEFGNKFQRAHLDRKLVNLVTEVAEGGQIADAELKAIVSGEVTTAEHKSKDPFEFSPYVTCWFGANHLPHTKDYSDAVFRRAIIMPFNMKFVQGKNADPNLKRDLLQELPGIMVKALDAYAKVLMTGKITESKGCLEVKEKWRTEVDQVSQFFKEYLVLEPGAELNSSEVYKKYRQWADDMGIHKKVTQITLSKRLVSMGCELVRTNKERRLRGIRFGWKGKLDDTF